MSMCRVVSYVVGRGCLLWPVHSLRKILSLCPASFCTSRPNLPVTQGLLLHPSPLWWKGCLFWLLVLEGLVGLHGTFQLQLLQSYWLRHRLGLLWYWIFLLVNKQRSFCHFWVCTQVLHFLLFCWVYPQRNGGVEECVLIFSCENFKITTRCWTINKRILDPTKKIKRFPMSKSKGEARL